MKATSPIETDADVVVEAQRLIGRARVSSMSLRVLGGAAVLMRSRNLSSAALRREVKDIDLITSSSDRFKVAEMLAASGYQPDKEFNAFQGRRRLLFFDRPRSRQLDVFVGDFSMCHVIPLGSRLTLDAATLPLAELALTKLQIVKLNEKDRTDLYRLILANDVGDADGDIINARRIAELCSRDWGLERTVTMTVDRLRDGLASSGLTEGERKVIGERLDRLGQAIASRGKSQRWRLRAMIGDRVRWYEDPDEP
jgi:hypothetical protein